MHQTKDKKEKLRLYLKIFLPILIYQLANYSTAFIDTMMTGRYQTAHLAGVSIGGSIWTPVITLLAGIITALVPIVGQELGEGKKELIRRHYYQFLYLAVGLAILVLILGAIVLTPLLQGLYLSLSVHQVARSYLSYLGLGLVPYLLFTVVRCFIDALGLTRLSMYLMLLMVPFNAGLNYLFIYGKGPSPELGGAGAGLGTALAYWLLLLVSLLVLAYHPVLKSYQLFQVEKVDTRLCREALRLGLPIGGSNFAEVAFFAIVGIFMAKFSTEVIAAHQSAINFASLMYAFPLANSIAMSIVISYEVGGKRYEDARAYTFIGLLSGFILASFTLVFLYVNRFWIAGLYGKNLDFIALVTQFLTYSLLFQLSDAFAAPIQGILRGYKDTRVPFVICVMSYWALCIPFGLILDATTSLGPFAYWIGLILGLLICGLSLAVRLMIIQKRYKETT